LNQCKSSELKMPLDAKPYEHFFFAETTGCCIVELAF
jgi:hypothetical protein